MIYRKDKGAPLTSYEVDSNFKELVTLIQSGLSPDTENFATKEELKSLKQKVDAALGNLSLFERLKKFELSPASGISAQDASLWVDMFSGLGLISCKIGSAVQKGSVILSLPNDAPLPKSEIYGANATLKDRSITCETSGDELRLNLIGFFDIV